MHCSVFSVSCSITFMLKVHIIIRTMISLYSLEEICFSTVIQAATLEYPSEKKNLAKSCDYSLP